MPLNLIKPWSGVLCLVLLTALPAAGQDLEGMQLFAPAEVGPYGDGPQPKEGYFFVFDGLSWSIGRPDVVVVGNTTEDSRIVYNVGDATTGWTQTNTHDTGEFTSARTEGNRIEFGRVTNRHGWMFSAYRLNSQSQNIAASAVGVVLADDDTWGVPSGGRLQGPVVMVPDPNEDPNDPDDDEMLGPDVNLPVVFDDLFMKNRVEHWNVELMALYRMKPFHRSGNIEWFAGLRYMEFDDEFKIEGRHKGFVDTTPTQAERASNILANSVWDTSAQNHIVGPQFGVRVFKKRGRWMLSTEGRFFAGFNYQNIHQRGTLGTELDPDTSVRSLGEPSLMLTTDFEHVDYRRKWSPVMEVRADVRYQLTKSVSVRAGWTGVWIDGLARASSMIDYTLRKDSVMGILPINNKQDVLAHGLTIGVDVNR